MKPYSLSLIVNKDYIGYLASEDAILIEKPSLNLIYIQRKEKDIGKHLVGKTTRDYLIKELLQRYGSIKAVNKAIEERKKSL